MVMHSQTFLMIPTFPFSFSALCSPSRDMVRASGALKASRALWGLEGLWGLGGLGGLGRPLGPLGPWRAQPHCWSSGGCTRGWEAETRHTGSLGTPAVSRDARQNLRKLIAITFIIITRPWSRPGHPSLSSKRGSIQSSIMTWGNIHPSI